MTNEEQPTEQPEQPNQEAQVLPSPISPVSNSESNEELELTILRRLASTFKFAVRTLDNQATHNIYVVLITNTESPVVTQHATREEAAGRLFELQQCSEENRSTEFYILIFYGVRWQLVQGDLWKMHDGHELIALSPRVVEDFVDPSGLIHNAARLDDAVEEREQEVFEEEPEEEEEEL